jgi:transcriptional regulator with XRE-family HTH domain
LGEHLIKRRAELRLLQREVAERIGTDLFSLIHWEKGQHEPAIRFWPRIISFLGYDPSPVPISLGDHIRAERRRRGFSLALLARECGFDQGTLALIEADAYPHIDPRVRASHAALQRRYGVANGSLDQAVER